MGSDDLVVALPSGVEYGGILGTNDLVFEIRKGGNLEDSTREGLVARGMTTVIVDNELHLGLVVCSLVLEWSHRGL